jgi:hypothetical protein
VGFDRSKKRPGIHSVRVQGEIASVDEKAAASFPGELQQIIEGHFLKNKF